MTRKTPQQKLQELDARQAKIEDELKQKRAAITRAKRREQAKLTNEKRKLDTRRKILVGAAILDKVENGSWPADKMQMMMDAFLVRDDDRALFDLPPKKQPEG